MARRYANLDSAHRPHDFGAILRWGVLDRLTRRRRIEPAGPPAPSVPVDLEQIHAASPATRLTWIGHASFLGSLGGGRFLIDPVFSERAGWVVRRHVPAALQASQLPSLDVLLITHSHYDHLDEPSVAALPRSVPVCVPRGLRRWFLRRGFRNVTELAWWESTACGALTITLVPARHWSRRGIGDTNATLWGGYVIDDGHRRIYHCGDSAWFDGFDEIGRRFPGLLAAMLPVGSYSPTWFMEPHHLNPEQACRAFHRLGARHMVPMHWGTFKLTDEPLCEPVDRLRAWWMEHAAGVDGELHVMSVGQTVVLDD